MKKSIFLLLMSILALGTYAATGTTVDDAVDFSWTEGHLQEANTLCWYRVNLSEMPDGYDALLYLNNIDDAVATITAQPFVMLSSLSSINDAVTKKIEPGRNYAMNLSHSTINALNTKIVYVSLKTDKTLRFSAEPVEPGEKDLDCLNALEFVRTGTTVKTGNTWYTVDITDLKADPSKTLQVSVTNQGSAAATVTAGISFDCPSTATTDLTRTLAAGETRTKIIDRALFDMVAVDLLYVQVLTSQPLHITATVVEAPIQHLPEISGEIDFQLEKQYTQSVGEQWYKVNAKELREAGKIAELTLSNMGTANASITADVAFSNPATSLMTRTITLSKGAVLVRDLARNLLESVAGDYVWIRLSTTAEITFSARLKTRTEGTACMAARAFDWENGDWQTGGTTVWYAVDITEAKSADNVGKDIMLTVENLSQKATTLAVQLAFDCPYTGTTDATRTLAAGAKQSKRIERGLYSNLLADIVYVGLSTEQNIRITATLVDAEDTDWSKDCVLDNAVLFDWEKGNDQAANTAVWYKVDLTPIFDKADTVPEITVTNLGAVGALIAGELAFDCPASEPTTQRSIEIVAGGSYVKTPARNLIETLAENVVYIRVETTQPIHIQASLKKENEGLNCLNAIDFDWVNGNTHPADKTLWYKIDLTNVKNTPGQAVRVGIQNKNGIAGGINANIYFDCGDDVAYSYSMTLGANARKETDLGRALIMNLNTDVIYIELTSEQTDSLYAIIYEDVLIEPIEACADALPVEYNIDIEQPQGEQWYYVDINYLQKFTGGDATLTITNKEETSSQLTAQVAWACPVTEQMLDRTLTLGAGAVYSKVITRTLIEGVANDTAWICITASSPVTFRIDISDERGESCSAPILFDWVNGNIHPADATLWYKVELDTLKNESEDNLHDFRLNVQNLMDAAISASAEIYFDCLDDPTADLAYDFTANELKHRDIDRDLLETFGWAPLLIKFSSTGDVHLYAELIEPIPDIVVDTLIEKEVCEGDFFEYIKGDETLQILIQRDTVWHDTIRFTLNYEHYTQLGDSVYTYQIACKKSPEFLPVTVKPVVVAGKAIDVTEATQALLDAFAAQKQANEGTRLDAEVTDIYWQIQQTGNRFTNLTDNLLDTRTDLVVMRYVILTECEDEIPSEPIICQAEEPLRESTDITAIVCPNTEIQSRLQTIVITADTAWNDTVYNLVHEEGVQLKDSVYAYAYRVWKQPLVPAWSNINTTLQPQSGASLDVTAVEQEILTLIAADAADDVIPVVAVIWEVQDAEGNWQTLTDTPVAYDAAALMVRFGLQTEATCSADILYSETEQVKVTPAEIVEADLVTDIICAGDTYTPEHGEPCIILSDTAWVEIEYVGTVENHYPYQITVFRPVELPTQLTLLPVAICGQFVQTNEAETVLMTALEASLTNNNSSIEELWWEIFTDNAWRTLADYNTAISSAYSEITLRYVVRTACNDTLLSESFLVEVQAPNADNTPDLDNMPAVSKYNDWLLMINLNKINEMGYFPAEEDVVWYRVNGTPDKFNDEQDDEFLATGYYYTIASQLTGDYYARINIAVGEDNECGASLRTVILSCASAEQEMSIAPSMVAPGETVEISGLNPELTYVLEVYNLTGVCMQRMEITDVTDYTFTAQTVTGYYMVNVKNEANMQTLKYIVK